MTRPDGIILDIDGTLWDSTAVVAEAWNEAVSQRPDISVRFTPEALTHLFGKTLDTIADIAFPALAPDDRHALIDRCCELENRRLLESDADLLYPAVADTIRALSKRFPLFIVSNCQSGYIELFLEKTGLGSCITDFECPGGTGLGKGPNLQLVAKRNHLEHPVYVGDTKGDQEACAFAGIPFCHASYGFEEVEKPDFAIRQFSELLAIF